MKSLPQCRGFRCLTFGFAAAMCFTPAVFAGTIITAGLPANTAIVNISGTADGAATYDSTQTYWYSPFSTNNSLLEYTVQPGTYSFRIVNPTDATALYGSLTPAQQSQIYTAWTYNSPWIDDYLVFDSAAASNPSLYQLFTGAVTPLADAPGFANANAAYNAAKTGGYFDQIVSGVGGRYNGSTSTDYTFTSAETLIFAIPDNILGDNGGGVSVLVSGAAPTGPSGAPEPASLYLLVPGLGAVGFLRYRALKLARMA